MERDEIDSQLAGLLRDQGRLSYEALAQSVGLSRVAVRSRIERLIASGEVRVVGMMHPAVFGLNCLAIVTVTHTGDPVPLARQLAAHEEASFVSIIAGRAGIVVELQCESLGALDVAVAAVRDLAPVQRVETAVYTRVLRRAGAPVPMPAPLHLDEIDRRLIRELQQDGRVSFAMLGRRIAMSPSAIRTRVMRLVDAGVIQIRAIMNPTAFGATEMCGFHLSLNSPGAGALDRIAAMSGVNFLAATVGRADAVGTLVVGDSMTLRAQLAAIRRLPDISDMETWMHLDVVKERYDHPIETLMGWHEPVSRFVAS